MDIYCPKCGEPWEMDTLHDVAEERSEEQGNPYWVYVDRRREKNELWNEAAYNKIYSNIKAAFQREGCSALGEKCNEKPSELHDRTYGLTPQDAAAALYDILGDDLDGAAAMLEDMGY